MASSAAKRKVRLIVHPTDREWPNSQPHARTDQHCRRQKGRRAMSTWLSEREQRLVAGAEAASAANADSHPDCFQRRVSAAPAERYAEEGRGADQRARRRERQAPRLEPQAVPAHELRHGGGIPRHERHLRQCFPGRARRGPRARIDAGARARPRRSVHLRRPDPFRARRLRSQRTIGAGGLCESALEPEDEGAKVSPRSPATNSRTT